MNDMAVASVVKNKGETPVNFSQDVLIEWRDALSGYAEKHGSLYAVSDTETTGPQIIDKKTSLFNRVLEWSICFCYKDDSGLLQPCLDRKGQFIVFDEPINPFITRGVASAKQKRSVKEIESGAVAVHGITIDYLFGLAEGEKSRPILPSVAPTFDVVLMSIQSLLSFDAYKKLDVPVFLVFHNAPFDIRFLNHECESWELSPIESYFGVIDTLALSKRIFSKSEVGAYSLDSLYEYGRVNYPHLIEHVERPIHSALIDSLILRQVYNVIVHHAQMKKLNSTSLSRSGEMSEDDIEEVEYTPE